MKVKEWISKFDNGECDKLSQMEQIEIKDMLLELKNSRNAISEICWSKANGMYCQDCVIRKYGVCPDKKGSLYGEWERDSDGR
jgi:hypothetical protein